MLNIKKIFLFFGLLSFVFVSRAGFGDDCFDGFSQSDSASSCTNSPAKQLIRNMETAIHNFDLEALGALLSSDGAINVDKTDRSSFYDLAKKKVNDLLRINDLCKTLLAQATNLNIKNEFDHSKHVTAANKIKKYLFSFIFLENFSFPQALFSPRPFPKGDLRPSLDCALKSLIVNEQNAIKICCFHICLHNISDELVNKKNQITIEIITDQDYKNFKDIDPIKRLQATGIPLLAPQNDDHEHNHHKFFIFYNNILNKRLVWAGSYNPTNHAKSTSWDDVNIFDDERMFNKYIARFQEVKEASKPLNLNQGKKRSRDEAIA